MAHRAGEKPHPHAWSADWYLLDQGYRQHGGVTCAELTATFSIHCLLVCMPPYICFATPLNRPDCVRPFASPANAVMSDVIDERDPSLLSL